MHAHNVRLLSHKNYKAQLYEPTWVNMLIISLGKISKSFTEEIKKVILIECESTVLASQIWGEEGIDKA